MFSVFAERGPWSSHPALLSFTCSLLSSLCHQAAEASRKKLEEEMAAFLSMLKDDGLAESKTSYLIIYEHDAFVSASIFHNFFKHTIQHLHFIVAFY